MDLTKVEGLNEAGKTLTNETAFNDSSSFSKSTLIVNLVELVDLVERVK